MADPAYENVVGQGMRRPIVVGPLPGPVAPLDPVIIPPSWRRAITLFGPPDTPQ